MYSLLIHSFYLSIHLQSQLESIGVVNIYPKTGFSDEELKMYLATPPAGKSFVHVVFCGRHFVYYGVLLVGSCDMYIYHRSCDNYLYNRSYDIYTCVP